MCEPLRGKKQNIFNLGEYFHKDDVKSAVEFYKKYWTHYGALKLTKDYPDIYKEWLEETGWEIDNDTIWDWDDEEGWNDWLFDYCFKDVIE